MKRTRRPKGAGTDEIECEEITPSRRLDKYNSNQHGYIERQDQIRNPLIAKKGRAVEDPPKDDDFIDDDADQYICDELERDHSQE